MPYNVAQIQAAGGFEVIYADPAWQYKHAGGNGAAENQYRTIPTALIAGIPVELIAAKHCVLFLWATYPLLEDAFTVMRSWGFKYKTIGFNWVKYNKIANTPFFGQGSWSRGNTEPCLIATRGKPKCHDHAVSQLIETFEDFDEHEILQARKGQHSAKPPEARTKIERLTRPDALRVELFARQGMPGWDFWGNEVTSTIEFK